MMHLRLLKLEKEYLLNNVLKNRNDIIEQIIIKETNSLHGIKCDLTLNDDIADLIRDLCAEKLQIVGFDKDYELTAEGRLLEKLIDCLYIP